MNPAPIKPTVSVSALDAMDVRVGTIEAVEDVPHFRKLLRLIVNFGDHRRTILSGMKGERANPLEIQGREGAFRSEAVEDVPHFRKLLRLIVNFGDHRRTILSGMKGERANPLEIQGRQALFVVNLEPRKIAGEAAAGEALDLGFADGIAPALAVPERAVPDGTRAG